jgi:hypothetical protein
MYEIYNNVEDKTIFKGNERELIVFTEILVIENEDTNYSVLGISDAIEYIEDYCGNLELIEE